MSIDVARTHTYTEVDVAVDGGTLHAGVWEPRAAADGVPTVLAIHGITATHRAWDWVAPDLAGVRVVAPDLRGRGRSNGLPGPFGMARHADDVAALADQVGARGVVVTGHSMGGFVAVVLAHRHPAGPLARPGRRRPAARPARRPGPRRRHDRGPRPGCRPPGHELSGPGGLPGVLAPAPGVRHLLGRAAREVLRLRPRAGRRRLPLLRPAGGHDRRPARAVHRGVLAAGAVRARGADLVPAGPVRPHGR
ncbi:alpha/beta fold hydrolase [Georgenia yuyongxinii]